MDRHAVGRLAAVYVSELFTIVTGCCSWFGRPRLTAGDAPRGLATNLLIAIGAAPHLHRPNFRIVSRWYPPGVQLALLRFGERALRHFIYLERPEGMDLDDAEGFTAVGRTQPLTDGDQLMAVPEDYQTVGHLYRRIEQGLERLVARHGEAGVFIGPPRPRRPPRCSSGRS